MAGSKKAGAKAPARDMPLTPQNLQKAMRELEPEWTAPTIEQLAPLIDEISLLVGFVKKREPRAAKPRVVKPVKAALKLLREAAESRMLAIESGKVRFVAPDLQTPDDARAGEALGRVSDFLSWLGADADEDIAAIFGEMPAPAPFQSWHGKARIWAPMIAAIWRPESGRSPLSERSSIVRVLHGLLIATGEVDKTMACTRGAVSKFLRDNKELLDLT
jgi:hypothetical protein